MNKKLKVLFQLFFDYFKIGLFTFGGGLAMISLIEKTFVEKRKTITKDDLLDMVAISEATPGVIAVNSATFLGYRLGGVLGSVFATIGVCLPSFLIILIISFFYEKFIEIELIKFFINGLMIGVTFLIFRAFLKVYKAYKKGAFEYVLILLSFVSILLIKIFEINFSSVFIVLICGLLSLFYYLILVNSKNKKCDSKIEEEEENKK